MPDLLISDQDKLDALTERLAESTRLVLDTEFVREKTYHPQACLLQIATGDTLACVDLRAPLDFGTIGPVLLNRDSTKVIHAARQDLEIFYRFLGNIPGPLFDTQIAAAFCGFPDQIGYAGLVQQLLGVTLDKQHTRTDWSRRPLSDAQLEYAADDVRYLVEIDALLRERLQQLGRLEWAAEESRRLEDESLYKIEPENAADRVKGRSKLQPASRAVVNALAEWREREAQDRDRPRQWILKDQELIALAETKPTDSESLQAILGRRLRGGKESTVLGLIRDSVHTVVADEPMPPPLTAKQKADISRLMKQLREIAEDSGISAPLLATRRDVTRLVLGERELELLKGWRREVAGELLAACD